MSSSSTVPVAALGAAALVGPLLQTISYRAHAEHGMIAVAIVAAVIGVAAGKASRPLVAAVLASAAFLAASYALARISNDAVGPFRMHYSMVSAGCIALALAPLYASANAGPTASGAWLLWIAAGAVPEAWWVERQVISVYTIVAGAAALAGLALLAAGMRRRGPRPSPSRHAAIAAAVAIAHIGVVVAVLRH